MILGLNYKEFYVCCIDISDLKRELLVSMQQIVKFTITQTYYQRMNSLKLMESNWFGLSDFSMILSLNYKKFYVCWIDIDNLLHKVTDSNNWCRVSGEWVYY